MAWKEADLLNDLQNRFISISEPICTETSRLNNSDSISWMMVNVLEVKNTDPPVAIRRNITYYVKNRGLENEEAWYSQETNFHINISDLKGGLLTTALFKSQIIRDKVLSQMFEVAHIVYREDVNTPNHEKRKELCIKVALDQEKFLNIFSMIVSLWPIVREKKLDVSDEDVREAILYWWNDVAMHS